jgi:hypothetical protein
MTDTEDHIQDRDGSAVALADVPTERACTRCDGAQVLVGSAQGLGKFRCDSCAMVVGFDLEARPAEFLLDRGLPGRYTKRTFGTRLLSHEQRLS